MAYALILAANSPGAAEAVKGFELTPQGIGSILGLILTFVTIVTMILKNKKDSDDAGRTYQKDVQTAMAADIAKLRKNSEKYLILRKILIADPTIDHTEILKKMVDQYNAITTDDD